MQQGVQETKTGSLSRSEGFSRQQALQLDLRKKLRTSSSLQAAADVESTELQEYRARCLAYRASSSVAR